MEPLYAIGYARVSSPKQAQQGESLDDQTKAIKGFVQSQGWMLYPDEVLEEQFTGSADSRPLYDFAIKIIKKNPGKIKFFVVKVIDRFSRGGSGAYHAMKDELARLGVELRDIGGVIQPKVNSLQHLGFSYPWSENSPSQLTETVLAEVGRGEKSNILLRLISAEIGLTQKGFQVGRPDDGYLNDFVEFDGKKRCVLKPDPERASFFTEMFKLRAEGVYSDTEIVEHINKMGYSSKSQKRWNQNHTKPIGASSPKKLTVKQLQRIIARPAYCGIICEKWTHYLPIKAQWKGLVNIDIFNKANRGKVFLREIAENQFEILYNQNPEKLVTKRHKFRKDFFFKNIILCSRCGKPMKASSPRGKSGEKFPTYHCARNHKQYSMSREKLDTAYNKYLSSIRFKKFFLRVIEETLLLKFRKEEGVVAKHTSTANQRVAILEQKKSDFTEAYNTAKSPEMRDGIEEKVIAIQKEIYEAREIRDKLEVGEDDIHRFIAHAKNLMEHPAKMLENISNMREQIALFSLFFEQFPTYEELLNGTPKLTLVFKLNEENEDTKSLSVTLPGVAPGFQD